MKLRTASEKTKSRSAEDGGWRSAEVVRGERCAAGCAAVDFVPSQSRAFRDGKMNATLRGRGRPLDELAGCDSAPAIAHIRYARRTPPRGRCAA
jgi:hypothetical protein